MATDPLQQRLSLRHNVPGTVYVLHFEPAYKHLGTSSAGRPATISANGSTSTCKAVDRR